ncbi:gamma glutamyl transpeptidase, putative [Pediculus humanus corporis]|uniref:Gamma glutamyl transpeptidase, putative n=1 Tax=Pediculus humanus subsp. corporis TaxID=121224 RepID=E0V9N2_PEDHC|nr:gamma glutamyl transpeptidase, putative [Pediculus humanus corporis]EEB10101.1 gamma glutamyl transpeptidase, putative [Pediculus humanus corporis]
MMEKEHVNEQEEGSLKTIILNFFGFTIIITIALIVHLYYGNHRLTPHGSVASDDFECSKIGLDLLKVGGNSIDAAIATVFCLGVVNFHITGLGGYVF